MDMKRHFLCLSMVTALALAGCNGGGGGGMMPVDPAETKKAVAISEAIAGIKNALALPAGNDFPDFVDVKRTTRSDLTITLLDGTETGISPNKTIKYNAEGEFTAPKYSKATDVTAPTIADWYGETQTRSSTTGGNSSVTVYTDFDQDNNNYLVFGYWLNKKEDNGYLFKPIFDGIDPYFQADLEDLVGNTDFTNTDSRATYTGAAAGRYVEKTLGSDSTTENATQGQFTAEASFTAYFGQDSTIPTGLHNTITGAITNFKDGDKTLSFRVGLESVSLSDDFGEEIDLPYESGIIKASHGDTQHDSGSWSFDFFGPSSSDSSLKNPTGIAGAFGANFSDGNVAGAFGATED